MKHDVNPEAPVVTRSVTSAEVTIVEHEGSIRVRDPRMFRAERRGFCRRLVEQAALESRIRRVEVDLESATVRMDFGALATSQAMALAFAEAIHRAFLERDSYAAGTRKVRVVGLRTGDWSSLTAFRSDGDLSVWETLELKPGQLRVRHHGLRGDRARVTRVAESLAASRGCDAHSANSSLARFSRSTLRPGAAGCGSADRSAGA